MNKWAQIIFGAFLLFLFLEILVGFPINLELNNEVTQNPRLPDEFPENRERNGMQQKMEGVHLAESQKGARDWELFAKAAESTKGQGLWQLQTVRVLFYNQSLVEFTVVADKAEIDSNSKNIRFLGHVVTQSPNGYEFKTETLIYNQGLRLLESPDEVLMTAPPDDQGKGMALRGRQLEADVGKSLMVIKDQVRATKDLSGRKTLKISSQRAEFSSKNRMARFVENVMMEAGALKMEGPEALFEYKSGQDFLQSIMVRGGVKVSDVDKFATSDAVKFDPEQNKFTFTGRPRVVQNSDEITGEQIVFIDGGKKVKVEKIKAKVENK